VCPNSSTKSPKATDLSTHTEDKLFFISYDLSHQKEHFYSVFCTENIPSRLKNSFKILFANIESLNKVRANMKKMLLSLAICIVATPTLFAASRSSKSTSDDHEVVSTSRGMASWYGGRWIGRKTANGEIYRAGDMTAAHKTLPFGTRVRVTDVRTGESTVVRINNRGPFVKGRVIDLSEAAASDLGMKRRGVARVKLEVLAREKTSKG
jgi:rare lipoprotein A